MTTIRIAAILLLALVCLPLIACDQLTGGEEDPAVTAEKTKETQALITRVAEAIDKYHRDAGMYPTSNISGDTNGLADALSQNGFEFEEGERKGNLRGEIIDAWGNALQYRVTGEIPDDNERKAKQHNDTFDLYSAGPDGEYDTADDIGNW